MAYKPSELKTLLQAGQVGIQAGQSGHLGITRDATQAISSEYQLQRAVIIECKRLALGIPDYDWVYAIPNGQYRPGERLEPGTATGYPDLGWDIPRGGYHGARFELKYNGNGLDKEQRDWHAWLTIQGYYVVTISDSVERIMSELEAYRTGQRRRERGKR